MKNDKALRMNLPTSLWNRIEKKAEENNVSASAFIRLTMTKECNK